MYRAKHLAKQGRRPLCVLLALVVLATVFTTLRLPAQAAGAPTSLGLAEHGLMAYRDNWQYVYGGKGADTDGDGLRESDCAGLIYAYFSDQGALGNCQGACPPRCGSTACSPGTSTSCTASPRPRAGHHHTRL